jgi:hypothetical protein
VTRTDSLYEHYVEHCPLSGLYLIAFLISLSIMRCKGHVQLGPFKGASLDHWTGRHPVWTWSKRYRENIRDILGQTGERSEWQDLSLQCQTSPVIKASAFWREQLSKILLPLTPKDGNGSILRNPAYLKYTQDMGNARHNVHIEGVSKKALQLWKSI